MTMKKHYTLLFLFMLQMLAGGTLFGQCPAGYQPTQLNWVW